MGTLEVKERNGVSVSLPHSDGVGQTIYKGNTESAPTKDCVLIIDHETGELTLERITNKIMLKKTRPEKREKGEGEQSLPEAKVEAANPYEVKANPYEVKPNPYEVKPNPYEVKPRPPSSAKPKEKPPRSSSSSSSGGKAAQPGAQGKRRSPAQPPHLVDSLSPMHSNKSSPASTSGRGPGSQYVDSLGRPLSSSSSSSDSDSDPDDPPAAKVPPPSKEAPSRTSRPPAPALPPAPAPAPAPAPSAPPTGASMPQGLGMPGDLEDLLSSRPPPAKPRTSRPPAPSLPPAPAPPLA